MPYAPYASDSCDQSTSNMFAETDSAVARQGREAQPTPEMTNIPEALPASVYDETVGNSLPEPSDACAPQLKGGESEEIIQTSAFRFVVLVLFAAFGFINQVQYVAFAFIVRETQSYFDVDSIWVNVLCLIVPVIYVIAVVPGCYVYNKVGLRYGIIIGAALNAFASLLKLVAVWVPKYPLLIVAQVLVAGGQIFFLSLPTLIAGIWFPPSERTIATAVASLLGFAGMAVGMFYSPHVVSLPDNCETADWAGLMGSQCGFSVLVLVLIVFLVSDKPKYRPSHTATEDYKLPITKFLKYQLRDLNFVLLTVAFGLIAGFLTAIAGVLPQVVQPFAIDETTAGILAFAGILGGSANCAVVGTFVDYTHLYKRTAIALATAATVLFLAATVLIKTLGESSALRICLYILVPLLCFLVLPVVPVVMELAVELAYPCPETVPSTIVLASMCFFSFVGMIVFSIVLGDEPTEETGFYVVLITLVVSAIGLVGLFFVKEKLRRLAEDQGLVDQGKVDEPSTDAPPELTVETGVVAAPVLDVRQTA